MSRFRQQLVASFQDTLEFSNIAERIPSPSSRLHQLSRITPART